MGKTFDTKMLGYAALAAAGATGTAEAAIVTTPTVTGGGGTNIKLNDGTTVAILATDGVDANTTDSNPDSPGDPGSHGYLKAGLNNTTASTLATTAGTQSGGQGLLTNFAPGSVIGSGTNFTGTGDIGYFDNATSDYYTPASASGPGLFPLDTPGYAGIRFQPVGALAPDYGYITLTVSEVLGSGPVYTATLTYDDSGAAITIPGGTTPEPASLGLLAVGAVGLLRRRHSA